MTHAKLGNFLNDLRRLAGPPPSSESDHLLLARFLAGQDEAAFAALLGRHGPMVFAVSRRILGRAHDAEDVVQAVFLLLARKAGTIRKRTSLSCWLHGVARRLSIGLKRQQMNRSSREKNTALGRGQVASQPLDAAEIQELLDASLLELPEKYRAALILCYLEGQTQEEAARRLGCPLGTVRSRLARGRDLLRKKLTRRGLALSGGALATLLTAGTAPAALPIRLFGATLHAAVQYASGKSLAGLVSASVALLVNSGLKSIAVTKMLWVSVGVLALGLIAGGAGLAAKNTLAGADEPPRPRQVVQAQASQPEVEKPKTDRLGDPLPPHALLRLGTLRFRHGEMVRHLDFSPDGKTILSADGYGVYIWDASTGRVLRRIGEHRDQWSLHCAAFANNGTVALATRFGTIDIMDTMTGGTLRHFEGDRFPNVALTPDGKILAVLERPGGKDDQFLQLYNAITGDKGHQLKGHQDYIHSLVFSRDSKTLVTSSDDKTIRFWDVGTGKQVRQLNHSTLVGDIALAPDGKTLASVAMKKTVHKSKNGSDTSWWRADHVVLWDLAAGKETHRLEVHPYGAYPLGFTPDGKTFVSSDSKTTKWWNVATGKELPERNLPVVGVMTMAFAPDGGSLATGSEEGTVQLWDLTTGKEKLPLGGHQGWVQGVAVAPDGRTFATGGGDNRIRLWDTKSGAETRSLTGHEGAILSLAFVPDGQALISTSRDATVRVWEFATGKELRRLPGSEAALSPDGKFLVTGSNYPDLIVLLAKEPKNEFVRVWEISTGRELQKWPSTRDYGAPLAFSSDGRFIYSWDADKKVRLWDVSTGKMLRLYDDHHFRADSRAKKEGICWAFSPDGKLVALDGGPSGQFALFDMATGKEIRFLKGHPATACSLAFSADNRVLASGDWTGGTVHLWEVATGQEFQQFAGHKGHVFNMAFSADGKVLLTGNEDTTALAWDLTGTRTGAKTQPLIAGETETAWSDLTSAKAMKGQKAVRTLLAAPEQAVTLLARKLKPSATPGKEQLARLIADVDSDLFKSREEAMRALEKLGDVAAPAVRQALAASPTLELKQRLESLLEKFSSSQRLRTLRAVQVLELIGSQASRELLTRLATGTPEALLTQEARAAGERLAKLRSARP